LIHPVVVTVKGGERPNNLTSENHSAGTPAIVGVASSKTPATSIP
jgi:hypothetical protein